MIFLLKPIPIKAASKEYKPICPDKSRLVRIVSNDKINVDMRYPQMNLITAVKECYVRDKVYEMLLAAQSFLPRGYRLKIWDAWRPFALQRELYEVYAQSIIDKFSLASLSDAEQRRAISQYVSYPQEDRLCPPSHTTGGAVDVTLEGLDGTELDMGTEFDEFSDKANTAYFENTADSRIRDNRRILYNCMIAAGFENLPSEWWHYSYGDKVWAYYNDTPALYEGIFSVEEIIKRNS